MRYADLSLSSVSLFVNPRYANWLLVLPPCPCDADPLTRSNFEVARAMLDTSRAGVEVHTFGGDAVRTFQVLIVDPSYAPLVDWLHHQLFLALSLSPNDHLSRQNAVAAGQSIDYPAVLASSDRLSRTYTYGVCPRDTNGPPNMLPVHRVGRKMYFLLADDFSQFATPDQFDYFRDYSSHRAIVSYTRSEIDILVHLSTPDILHVVDKSTISYVGAPVGNRCLLFLTVRDPEYLGTSLTATVPAIVSTHLCVADNLRLIGSWTTHHNTSPQFHAIAAYSRQAVYRSIVKRPVLVPMAVTSLDAVRVE